MLAVERLPVGVLRMMRKRPVILSITHKLNSDHDAQFDVC
jgi:hypothetical protein